jgi:serine phosphatase RsbU (regulator of sigma subunit)
MEVWGGNRAVDNGVVMPGLDAWVYAQPFGTGGEGGDLHYVSSCASGRITRVLVADVSGHGQGVAEIAGKLRGLMRRFVNYIDQTRLVEGLNREFAAMGEGGQFATAVIATYFAPTDYLTLSNAGHPRPLWYQARSRKWRLLTSKDTPRSGPANIPLGIAEPTKYDVASVHLAPDDQVVVYTDSLIEARDAAGRQVGEQGLLEIAQSLPPGEPDKIAGRLLEAVRRHAAGTSDADDITVVVLRPNDLKPRIGPVQGLINTVRIGWEAVRPRDGLRIGRPEGGMVNVLGNFFNRFNRGVGRRAGP